MKKIFIIIFTFLLSTQLVSAQSPYFIDFKYILNESKAGKKAQDTLKSKLQSGLDNLKKKEKNIQNEEKKIIEQKKLISTDEYKNKVSNLRKNVWYLTYDLVYLCYTNSENLKT